MSDAHRTGGRPERPDLRHLSAGALADRAAFFLHRADSLPELLGELVHRAFRLEAAEHLLGLMLMLPQPEPPASRGRPVQGPAPQQPEDDPAFCTPTGAFSRFPWRRYNSGAGTAGFPATLPPPTGEPLWG